MGLLQESANNLRNHGRLQSRQRSRKQRQRYKILGCFVRLEGTRCTLFQVGIVKTRPYMSPSGSTFKLKVVCGKYQMNTQLHISSQEKQTDSFHLLHYQISLVLSIKKCLGRWYEYILLLNWFKKYPTIILLDFFPFSILSNFPSSWTVMWIHEDCSEKRLNICS